ncbi:MAG: FAD-binding oxidoreductase [Thiocapsa sp.]|jgi:FAD/FMN-containing dehydrogenase|nr:FAD-binding oxidoreductase [Thiocapsa sp.]MCG6897484.1 FAD-binding oxidoreductase [Thiocapsa sp.]
MTDYAQRKAALIRQLQASRGPVGLGKQTSNLFRDRRETGKRRLDVRAFQHVLAVEPADGCVDTEGMTTYEALTDATLALGLMPAVVPQLKTITIGGAAAGVGIEASSFRYGLVHETLLELEVLLADGSVVLCTPDNEHSDLFCGFANSYGTLGYALRVKAKTVPVKPYVCLEHRAHADPDAFFRDLDACCAGDADFVDGAVFGPRELVLTVGRFADAAPYTSDYSYEHIYYRSMRERAEDYLGVRDFIWRWDTDWFWCSKNLLAQNPLIRRLYGRDRLGSRTYTKLMRLNGKWGLTKRLDHLRGVHPESVIQDVDIPVDRAPEFLAFLLREIGILPIWTCPVRACDSRARFDLYPLRPGTLYVNFGFWDVVRPRQAHPPGHFNRLIEDKVSKLGGIKSLYSESYFPEDEFWRIYGRDAYERLKARYDPLGVFGDLYAKCVLRR